MESSKTIFNAEKPAVSQVLQTNTDGRTEVVAAVNVSTYLMKIKGAWPFDFAPDEIIIEEERLIIKVRSWPFGETVITIPLERVSLFQINTDLFFSSIKIMDSMYSANNMLVKWLQPNEAKKAKALVDGLQLKTKKHIEVPPVKKETYVRTVQAIGQV